MNIERSDIATTVSLAINPTSLQLLEAYLFCPCYKATPIFRQQRCLIAREEAMKVAEMVTSGEN